MGNVITGTDLTIDVGKNYKGKLKVFGNTEQVENPSPELPIPIDNVQSKNKFDYSKASDVNNTIISNYRLFEISGLKPNTQYTFSGYDIESYTEPYIYLWNSTDYSTSTKAFISSPSSFNPSKAVTIEAGENGCIYLAMYNTTEDIWNEFIQRFEKAQLEIGITNTPYAPYNSIGTKITNKNKINIKGIEKGRLDNGVLSYNQATTELILDDDKFVFTINAKYRGAVSEAIIVQEGQPIYYSQNEEFTGDIACQAFFYNNAGQFISKETFWYNPIIVPEKTKFLKLWWVKTEIGTQTITNPQLEIGEVATEYERHKSQTVYFPLSEGQKLMEGSYLADDGVHNKRKQVVFDGSDDENWEDRLSSDGWAVMKKPDKKAGLSNFLCSHFKVSVAFSDGNVVGNNNFGDMVFIPSDNIATTLEEWKTWLSINPITVEYELIEEEIVPYTEEQQEAYNNLQNIYLHEGKNYISITSTLSPDLELKYLKIVEDLDFYISENGRLVIPEYGINYLIDFAASNIPSMPEAMEASVRIVGRDGDVVLNTTYEPIPFSIVCYTDDNLTPEQKVIEEQKIDRFMDSIKNKTKILGFERENKFYDVKYNGALTTVRFPAHVQFTIPVKSSESYAKDLIKKRIQGNGSENSETIKKVGAVFTVLGPAQTPKISFNNYEMFYDNVLLENTKLIIDSGKSTITHVNGVTGKKTNAMRYYNHQFPKVKYGENVLVVNSGIDDASQVKVEWNDLKL